MSDKPHWSDDWDQTESNEEYGDRLYRRWLSHQNWTYDAFRLTPEEANAMYDRIVAKFNAACDEIERQEDDAKIRHLLSNTLGAGTYMVEGD